MQNTRLANTTRLLSDSTAARLILIVLLAFAFRLALLPLIQNPGLHDPLHYYNLGRRLSQGDGFTIDYVWHYAHMPTDIVHPVDHWMPLAGLAAALGMTLAGATVHAALAVFVLVGAVNPLIAYMATKQLGQSDSCALFAAALAAVLPELVLNSLRPDTTILNMFLLSSTVLLFNQAQERQRRLYFAACGSLLGLAYLTRNDAIILLPLLVALLLYSRRQRTVRAALRDCLLLCLAFLVIVAPWLMRNVEELGLLGSPLTGRMPFMVEPKELYAYGMPITLESLFSRQSASELLNKRLFELAAALKQIGVSLNLPLALLAPAGLVLILKSKDRQRLRQIMPVLLWVIAILMIYPLFMPVHNQGGSFKKAFLSAAPLLIPLGALALWYWIRSKSLRILFALITLLWLAWSSIDLIRRETEFADTYHRSVVHLIHALDSLPDQNGDGEHRLMSQDPYVFSYYGFASIMTPLAARAATLELAQRHHIDYLMMPAARPALDSLYLGQESDPRFILAAHIDDAGDIPWELYRLRYER